MLARRRCCKVDHGISHDGVAQWHPSRQIVLFLIWVVGVIIIVLLAFMHETADDHISLSNVGTVMSALSRQNHSAQ